MKHERESSSKWVNNAWNCFLELLDKIVILNFHESYYTIVIKKNKNKKTQTT